MVGHLVGMQKAEIAPLCDRGLVSEQQASFRVGDGACILHAACEKVGRGYQVKLGIREGGREIVLHCAHKGRRFLQGELGGADLAPDGDGPNRQGCWSHCRWGH